MAQAQQATGGEGKVGASFQGGHGGGAGASGSNGSGLLGGVGGAAGTLGAPNGKVGGVGGVGGGGGGGGGGYSNVANGDVAAPLTGGNGGDGGFSSIIDGAGGGGGGGGGDGVRIDATGPVTINAVIKGGNGGRGDGTSGNGNGGGGGGGAGVVLLKESNTTVTSDVIGGAGGAAGLDGAGAGGGGGGAGVILEEGGNLTVNTGASIAGGSGVDSGTGGAGVLLQAKGTVTIVGGRVAGGAGAHLGDGGAAIEVAAGSTVVNAGTIQGGMADGEITGGWPGRQGGTGSGGAKGFQPNTPHTSVGGAGILGATGGGITIINSGQITGGTTVSRPANAISLFGSNNSLELWKSSAIDGNVVVSGGGTNNVLALGGSDDGSFDVSQIGSTAQYQGFDTYKKRGTSTWTLTGSGTQDWIVDEGTLRGDAASFGGNVEIASGASLNFAGSALASYAGVLSGSGGFNLSGTGTTVLSGNSSAFSGATTVAGGALVVGSATGGTLGGTIHVKSGALLGGIGTIGTAGAAVTIDAGGVHAPGSIAGGQYIAGNYLNHGTLHIEATPAGATSITVAGAVDITGATLDLALAPNNAASWNVFNGPFTILEKQSAGAIVGTFSPVTQNLLFLDALLDYAGGDGNDVTLELRRNDLAFASVGRTRNQSATGGAIGTLDDSHAVWRSIALTVDPDNVRKSFDALSGEIHASAKSALVEDSRFVRNAIDERLRAAFAAPGASHAPVLAYGPGDTPVAVAPDHAGPVVWSYGFGSWGSIDSDDNAASLERSTGGLLIGADGLVGGWRVGLLAGYSHSRFDLNDRFSSGSSDNYHLGLYGGTEWGNLAFRSGLAYTWNDLSTRRTVAIPGIAESLAVGYHAGTLQAFGEVGYGIETGAARFEPFANLAHVRLHTNGFTENGGVAALSGCSDTTDTTFTTLGLHAEHKLGFGTVDATLRGVLGWRHAFGDTTPTATQAFSAGDAFTIAGVPIAKDSAVIEAGLDLKLTPEASFGLSYIGQFASGARENGFKANLAVRF
ncbi:autotransporter outer membrane beta-barrel domain-containing protein [Pseudaminobacter soli (ex Li et al. 2025)]|uniref:autotransporter outer membrane beta-barrel domain-containing protein n=1 Tax=Pseudaminobacter soli (ex Li et al. 2025) TaxID=1295366 RepID=UPI0024764C91|nr:autotransporter domain-containing protein [Mesorhizobium soli]